MDSRKPLTAGEIEKLRVIRSKATPGPVEFCVYGSKDKAWLKQELCNLVDSSPEAELHFVGTPDGFVVAHTGNGPTSKDNARFLAVMLNEFDRLLSLLTPPPDAISPDAPLSLQAAISIGELRYRTRKEGTGSGWVEGADVETVAAYVAALESEIAALKTPPPDAAVREAGEEAGRFVDYERTREAGHNMVLCASLDTLLRAVQAPRLTGEDGVSLIAKERARQVDKEGWTPEHDAQHVKGELGDLAAYYCARGPQEWLESVVYPARWYMNAGKRQGFPTPTLRDLVKAGALIAAEIDRRRAAFPELAVEVGHASS